jgi:hypothetical protein
MEQMAQKTDPNFQPGVFEPENLHLSLPSPGALAPLESVSIENVGGMPKVKPPGLPAEEI